jgi:hypothetical protein
MNPWSKDIPSSPGVYLCRFVPGYEFVVTVGDGLSCEFNGRNQGEPCTVFSPLFQYAEWRVPEGVAS